MVFDHCPEILFDPSPAIISVDDITNDFQTRIGASFHTPDEAVNVSGSLDAVVLCLKRDDNAFRCCQDRPCREPEIGW